MKLENLVSIYKIDMRNSTVATIKEQIPQIEDMPVEEAVKIVKQQVIANETSLMEAEKHEAELVKASKCRICNKQGELITLARNRPAYFCKSHNTINPIPIELIKVYGFDYEPTM